MPDYSERFDKVFVHESSYIDDGVELGAGTKIWHFSHVIGKLRVGRELHARTKCCGRAKCDDWQ